nr:hypothetical protein [uncultured Chryseobacterium sp.]
MRSTAISLLLFFLFIQNITGQKQKISPDSISIFFKEIKTASNNNNKLWNKEVYGPLLLIDPKTRDIFANQADKEKVLKLSGNIYRGTLPDNINIANTATNWSGEKWAMVMLPLPQDKKRRIGLLAHESFHRIQQSLGFELNNVENNHLDQKEGRIYLRLELEALKEAIRSTSEKDLQQHLVSALSFRKYRQSLYDGAAASENLLELNEGLAEFTGVIVSGRNRNETSIFFIDGINNFFTNATFVRSFAYYTIPVYGYLLYNKNKNWNKKITAKTNLTDYFIDEFQINIPLEADEVIRRIADRYNGAKIIKEESEREEKKKKQIAEYKFRFIEQPHFDIQFEKMNVSFDPRNIIPIDDKGTVYPTIRVTDLWGILTVEKGALMSPKWDKISISNPIQTEDRKISGDGWVLELADGYVVMKNDTNGNYQLSKKLSTQNK